MITDDEHVLICAVRYAMGRRTYIVSIVCNYVKSKIPELSDHCIDLLIRDIEEEIKRCCWIRRSLGDECDEIEWYNLLETLKKAR